jgi:hypothetical protein
MDQFSQYLNIFPDKIGDDWYWKISHTARCILREGHDIIILYWIDYRDKNLFVHLPVYDITHQQFLYNPKWIITHKWDLIKLKYATSIE